MEETLNELLNRLKEVYPTWETKEGWSAVRLASQALYNGITTAIERGHTVTLEGEAYGDPQIIKTIGVLFNVDQIYFSSNPDAKYAFQGCALHAADKVTVS